MASQALLKLSRMDCIALWSTTVPRPAVTCPGPWEGTQMGDFGEPKQRGISVFDGQGRAEQREASGLDRRRCCQAPACRVARSQEKAPCPNKRAARGRWLRVAVPEAKRGMGAAALKPAGVSSWGSTLPPDDSKQGPRGVGMISGIQPVVFSTISCRRRKMVG